MHKHTTHTCPNINPHVKICIDALKLENRFGEQVAVAENLKLSNGDVGLHEKQYIRTHLTCGSDDTTRLKTLRDYVTMKISAPPTKMTL